MQFLLDTHAFLWFIDGDNKLSDLSRLLIQNADNAIYISMASLWEISIKNSLKKLELKKPFDILIPSELTNNQFTPLPIEIAHLIQLGGLPLYHRDPFDRLIIAQSLSEHMPIISKDKQLDQYGLDRVWL